MKTNLVAQGSSSVIDQAPTIRFVQKASHDLASRNAQKTDIGASQVKVAV
jgi:hypothetical protein